MKWKPFFKKVEYIVDKSIPFTLILLGILLIIEFFFVEIAEEHYLVISILHNLIVFIFILDLIFKYLRIRKFKKFLKECWLDILVVFPFYLVFRVIEEIILITRAGEEVTRFQGIFHLGRESSEVVKELESAGKIEKLERMTRLRRFLRPLLRMPRMIKAFIFYEKPKKPKK